MGIGWICFVLWMIGVVLWLISHHLGITKMALYKVSSIALISNFVIPLIVKTSLIDFRVTNQPEVIDSFIVHITLFYILNIVSIIIGFLRKLT